MDLLKLANEKKVLVVAHRGCAGGNIPCNTLAAYEIALRQGADIVELDVSQSADGALFTFHHRMEPVHLRSERYIADMTAKEVEQLRFVNQACALIFSCKRWISRRCTSTHSPSVCFQSVRHSSMHVSRMRMAPAKSPVISASCAMATGLSI